MPQIQSKDYHDYVIKDGRHVGEYEQMYQNIEDPWKIDANGKRLDMEMALMLFKKFSKSESTVLDVGCGKGLFTSFLSEVSEGKIHAFDVSITAIREAQERYQDKKINFFAFDLNKISSLPFPKGHFDFIVMAQLLWSILPSLRAILEAFRDLLKSDGLLMISQHFFQPEEQKYGNEIVEKPEDFIAILKESGYEILATLETNRFTNHHLALVAKSKRTV